MPICKDCGAIIKNPSKHRRRKRCEKHERPMEVRRRRINQ